MVKNPCSVAKTSLQPDRTGDDLTSTSAKPGALGNSRAAKGSKFLAPNDKTN